LLLNFAPTALGKKSWGFGLTRRYPQKLVTFHNLALRFYPLYGDFRFQSNYSNLLPGLFPATKVE